MLSKQQEMDKAGLQNEKTRTRSSRQTNNNEKVWDHMVLNNTECIHNNALTNQKSFEIVSMSRCVISNVVSVTMREVLLGVCRPRFQCKNPALLC